MSAVMPEEPGLEITIARDGDHLVWRVRNPGPRAVWAFLLVPTIVKGRLSFAVDAGWLAEDPDGTLVVRKVDTPPPANKDVDDAVRSGAVLLHPGDERRGQVTLGQEVTLSNPYEPSRKRVRPKTVILEVGWVPYREDAKPELLDWQGQPFAYLSTEDEPGGQRFSRSQPLAWRR